MMKYFRTADPEDMSQGELSERVRYLKTEKGGYEQMCEVAEKIFDRGREEGREEGERSIIIRMYERGMSKEMIADASGVSLEVVSEWLES